MGLLCQTQFHALLKKLAVPEGQSPACCSVICISCMHCMKKLIGAWPGGLGSTLLVFNLPNSKEKITNSMFGSTVEPNLKISAAIFWHEQSTHPTKSKTWRSQKCLPSSFLKHMSFHLFIYCVILTACRAIQKTIQKKHQKYKKKNVRFLTFCPFQTAPRKKTWPCSWWVTNFRRGGTCSAKTMASSCSNWQLRVDPRKYHWIYGKKIQETIDFTIKNMGVTSYLWLYLWIFRYLFAWICKQLTWKKWATSSQLMMVY